MAPQQSPAPDNAVPADILLVEDEASIRDVIDTALRYHGHRITSVGDGIAGFDAAMDADFDLIVLDIMLPGRDGFAVCERLRANGVDTPVLFLTARDAPQDRVRGFTLGGDDYLTKPFSVEELVLRVHAILRRTRGPVPGTDLLTVGDLTLEPAGREVRRGGVLIDLSPTEYRLLDYLMLNTGVVLSKAQILVNVWDDDFDGTENIVELYIGYLRRKIDDGRAPLIHTRRGLGYVLREELA